MEWVAVVIGVGELLILGTGGALVGYLVRIENRLTKIETKIGV